MGLVHNHVIIRAEVRRPFTKPKKVKKWLKNLVADIGMKICKHGGPHVDYVDSPGNCGIAGVVMIETSHISIHVWDQLEKPLVQMDVYSCAPFAIGIIQNYLDYMMPFNYHIVMLDRAKEIKVVSTIEGTEATRHQHNREYIPNLHLSTPHPDLGTTRGLS